uniref:Uncharacterized protein n=1 Tax=Lutzomyia longipalpis TaxID=7200 RepID=A0A1B0CRU5_LUTLO
MRKSLESRTTVDVHKALKSGDIAHSVLVKSLIEAYKRDDTSIIGNFLELFLKSLGTCCEINLGRVANAIQKGLLLDFVKEI